MWDSLKQEDLVEDYIKADNKIQQLTYSQVQANQGFVRHMFLWNLNLDLTDSFVTKIARLLRMFTVFLGTP